MPFNFKKSNIDYLFQAILFQAVPDVGGKRRLAVDRLCGKRLNEFNFDGMQHLPSDQSFAPGNFAADAVMLVAQHGMPD